jgi:hypothetical protein
VCARRVTVILIALVVIAFGTTVVASTISAGDGRATHTMPDGSTMQDDGMR